MYFKQFTDNITNTYTYLIADEVTLEAIIIDSVKQNITEYLKFLNSNNLVLKYSLDTHIHADHITGHKKLQEQTGCKIVMGEHADVIGKDIAIADNDILTIGNLKLQVIYTPGHTRDSYCFLLGNKLFTGDTLLINATGRTDLQNGSAKEQYNSLFNKILCLPEDIIVYPGHDYNGKFSSTIGNELKNNPRLQVNNEQEYINIMNKLNLPKPKYIDIAIPANLKCGAD